MITAVVTTIGLTARTARGLARALTLVDASRRGQQTTDSGTTLCCFNAHGLAGT